MAPCVSTLLGWIGFVSASLNNQIILRFRFSSGQTFHSDLPGAVLPRLPLVQHQAQEVGIASLERVEHAVEVVVVVTPADVDVAQVASEGVVPILPKACLHPRKDQRSRTSGEWPNLLFFAALACH